MLWSAGVFWTARVHWTARVLGIVCRIYSGVDTKAFEDSREQVGRSTTLDLSTQPSPSEDVFAVE